MTAPPPGLLASRPALPDDADVIAYHRYPDQADAPERPVYAAWVRDALERGRYLGFLVEQEGQVIAGAGVTLLEWGPTRGDPQPWRGRIVNVWTHPQERRRGHARMLVGECLEALRGRGVTRVQLSTSVMGRNLYDSLGFRASGTEMTLRLD